MGSVAKPRCARGMRCQQVLYARSPGPPTVPHEGDFCSRCHRELWGAYKTSRADAWMDKVNGAIETVFAQRPIADSPEKAVLWDLFELDPDNGAWKKFSDRGAALLRLDAKTLGKLRDWLDENKDQAVEDGRYTSWVRLRADVWLLAWTSQFPPEHQHKPLLPDTKDGLPLQIVAVRTDGKKWDLNIPIRAELLRLVRRYFSDGDKAALLEMPRQSYRDLRDRMEKRGFTLDKFTADDLWAAVYGEKRGRKRNPLSETDK
jgi:hypothetical protein